jgi:hypothetical protein
METGARYRVTSREAGEILLDMIVCHSCSEQAKDLGLDVERSKHHHRNVGWITPNGDDNPSIILRDNDDPS